LLGELESDPVNWYELHINAIYPQLKDMKLKILNSTSHHKLSRIELKMFQKHLHHRGVPSRHPHTFFISAHLSPAHESHKYRCRVVRKSCIP
jgi:hypothetical protein